jgi:PBSX family phage terminase large subunit
LFCKTHNLPYDTAKRHIKAKDRKTWLQAEVDKSADLKKALAEALAKEDPTILVNALKSTHHLAEEIMLQAYKKGLQMKDKPSGYGGFSSAGDAFRLALTAGQEVRESARDLQGIPTMEGEQGWIITRGSRPHWYQRDFALDLPSQTGYDMFPFIGGIRTGKTFWGARKTGDLAWVNRGTKIIVAAPTYRMLEDTTKAEFLKAIHEQDLTYEYKKTDNKVILWGDTEVLFRSLDKPQHLRGPTASVVWIDEGGQMKNDEGYKILAGRLSSPEAKELAMIITTTPDGMNWLYDKIEEQRAKKKCRLYFGKTEDNPSLPEAFLERARNAFDGKYAKQELEGAFINVFTGQAYYQFNRQDHVLPRKKVEYYPGLPLVLACDFNVAPMCWNVIQNIKGYLYVIDEIHIDGTSTAQAIEEFKNRFGKHRAGVQVYGDASGWYKATSSTATDYAIIKKAIAAPSNGKGLNGKMPNVSIHAGRSNPEVKSRVASMNGRLMNTRGQRRLFISDHCSETIKDLERVAFKAGTQELDKSDPERTHHTDAVGYFIEQRWPIAKIKGRKG